MATNYLSPPINVKISNPKRLNVKIGGIVSGEGRVYPVYTGDTEITPTQYTQILMTANTRLESDITINPIPENYGLITWNGSFIRVS